MEPSETPKNIPRPEQTGKHHYRPEIDGLRAVAVVSVIINHFDRSILPSGYLGVDIFFVISGFVITQSLAHRNDQTLRDFLINFYTRRLKRLAPALLFFTLITGTILCLFDPTPDVSLKTGFSSLFGLSNLYLLRRSTDYFATSTELNCFSHTWSLGVEEQFYFLFPLLVWTSGFGRLSARGSSHLAWAVGAMVIGSVLLFVSLYPKNQPAAYFLMPTRLWAMGCGCLLFLTQPALPGLQKRLPPSLLILSIIALLFCPLQFAVPSTIAVVISTAALILCLRPRTGSYAWLTSRPVVYIGRISYSLYLWHWAILALSRWTIGIHWWSVPIQFAFIFLISSASYHFIETPCRTSDWSLRRWRSAATGLMAFAGVAAWLTVLRYPLYGAFFTGSAIVYQSTSDILNSYPAVVEKTERLLTECNMSPHQLSGEHYRPKPTLDSAFFKRCLSGTMPGRRKMVLVGDSFAQSSARHLSVIAEKIGYDFRIVFGYGRPYPFRRSEIKAATSFWESDVDDELLITEILSSLQPGDILVLRVYSSKRQYLTYRGPDNLPPVDAYDRALCDLCESVRSRGARFVLIGANPTLSTAIIPQWFNLESSHHKISPLENEETAFFHRHDLHLREFFKGIKGASYFSLEPYICEPSGDCGVRDKEKLLYSDAEHLSLYAHDLFFDDLCRHLAEVSAQIVMRQ